MTTGKVWYNPKYTDEERRELDRTRDELIESLKKLPNIKPTRSGEVGFRPIKLGEPAPETPHERFKRERAERLRKEAAATKPSGGGGRTDPSS